jgi:hypothetical protein
MMLLALPVKQLRSTQHAEEKNREMMRRLWSEPWFVAYRVALAAYRGGVGRRSVYPVAHVQQVERERSMSGCGIGTRTTEGRGGVVERWSSLNFASIDTR